MITLETDRGRRLWVAKTRLLQVAAEAKRLSPRHFARHCWVVAAALLLAGQAVPAAGDEFSRDSALYRQLLTPITSVIDGKPFRDAIRRVSEQTRLNLCIDRRVDPTALVHPGELGPNVYSAIKTIAAERDCVVMPVAGVLLVGRPAWVDATASVLIKLPTPSEQDSVTVRWDDLATPDEALKAVLGETPAARSHLPHDLWPKTTWHGIDRKIALALVLAQFDQRPASGSADGTRVIDFAATELSGSCKRRYRAGNDLGTMREVLNRADRNSKVRAVRDALEVQATATAHRLATDALLERITAESPAKSGDDAVFSLKLKERAGAAINAFATKAGRRLPD